MVDVDKHDYQKAVAYARFAMIAPAINGTFTENSASAYFKRVAENEMELPDGKKKRYKWQTIKNWYLSYKAHGVEGLYPKGRIDVGISRRLDEKARNRIKELLNEFPKITGVMVREKLIAEGLIMENDVSVDTIQRYIKNNELRNKNPDKVKKQRLAWEFEHALYGYEADTCYTFYIFDENGEYRRTYLIAIIDGYSRMVVGARFFFNDNAVNFQQVWKEAVKRYGKSKVMVLDNGSSYRNSSTEYISAALGTQLIYNKPFCPTGKAVIERFFGTIKSRWLNADHGKNYHSLEELNAKLFKWVDEYNRTRHSALNEDVNDNHTPLERFIYDTKDITPWSTVNKRESEFYDFIDECFLHEETRKVNGDSTITIKNVLFDVPSEYLYMKVIVRYDPVSFNTIYINDVANYKKIPLKRTDKIENGKTRRTDIIY